jgi:2-hydroxyglutaryl-CoA dehydratase, D-component
LLGPMADGETRSQLHLLLEGGYGPLERLIIAHDSEALVRVFYLLRAFHKRDPQRVSKVPLPYFFDLLHMPHRTTGLYNRVRARQLNAVMAKWSGRAADESSLRQAIGVCNEVRRLLQRLQALRRLDESPLTGTQALKVMAASQLASRNEYQPLLEALIADSGSLPLTRGGRRVFVTGSAHDNPDLYRAIEAAGGRVVAEDFDWGDRAIDLLVEEGTDDPLDAIVDRYHFASPGAAKYSVAARAAATAAKAREVNAQAVVCYIRNGDPGPRWDVPAQREALGDVPLLLLDDQSYGLADAEPTIQALTRFFADPGKSI